jgi:dipeptidyl aminopeptidase/acylaminoacyl peptidase
MRPFSRYSRQNITIASPLDTRSLSRAVIAIVAIGALAACSADQNLPVDLARNSPSNSKVDASAFVYVSDASGVNQLWQHVGGKNTRITFSDATDKDPHSAAGHLVFASYRDGDEEIYMAKNDLSGLRRLTTISGEDEQPNLSPDGARIAFVSDRSGTARLWTMDSTGANQVALATGSDASVPEAAPAWSPNGTQIAFTSVRSGLSQVFVISSAGGTPVQLSHEMNGAFNPAWSADGKMIYFVSVVGAPSLKAVTVATNQTSDWVYDGAGIGQPACSTSGCFAVEGAYGTNGDIVSVSNGKNASTTMIVGTVANETSPTVLVP